MTDAFPPFDKDFFDKASPKQIQRVASNPKSSVWVNASAGSGKTTVLTDRVVRLLLDNVRPERILCLTFTRAAAAEMSIRITRRLSTWSICSDDDLRADLDKLQGHEPKKEQLTQARRLFARVLNCPGGMRIKTLHSFCQEILHRFPVEAGVSPNFTVIEEADAADLQDMALKHVLQQAGNASESNSSRDLAMALRVLAENNSEYNFTSAMRELLRERSRLEEALQKAGGGRKGLDRVIEAMRLELGLAPHETVSALKEQAVDGKMFSEERLRQLGTWIGEASPRYAPRGRGILEWLASSHEQRWAQFDLYVRCFLSDKAEPFAAFADKKTLQKYPLIPELADQEIKRITALQIRRETLRIAETTKAILHFGSKLIEQYESLKKIRAVMDYDDLIFRTDQLLRRPGIAPWILYKLDYGLEHILVDEAQDTSATQWNIVSTLAEEFFSGETAHSDTNRTLFVVGDEKQSIFSFQRADPEAFAAMRGLFATRISNVNMKYLEVPLRVSFRSAPAILKAVDHVFKDPEGRRGVSVEPVVHKAFNEERPFKRGRVEVWKLLPRPSAEEDTKNDQWVLPLDYETEHDQQAELAAQIAGKIEHLLKDQLLEGKNRFITPGDIMILLRRRGRLADLMVRALKERSIPVTGVDRMHLVKQLSVMDLLAMVQFVLLPEDDLNLATVLRGPLLNMSEEQLMKLAMGRPSTLWHQLQDVAAQDTVFAAAYGFLGEWLNHADFLTPYAMLAKILNDPCPGSKVSGRHALWTRLGTDALDPIEELLNAAQNFSHRHTPSLQNFLHWLLATETEIKREQDSGSGQVRIMTIHASKGLEAPIVFLPDTASVPQANDVPRFHWSEKNIPLYLASKPKALAARQRWDRARQKQIDEYRRLLYVALTRAAVRLYICGWEPARSSPEESWYTLVEKALRALHEPFVVTANSLIDDQVGHQHQTEIAFADPDTETATAAKISEISTEETSTSAFVASSVVLPLWATTSPPVETNEGRYLVPSRLTDIQESVTPDRFFSRGRIIHRLLQSLPDVAVDQRERSAKAFLASPQHNLNPKDQDIIRQEVLGVLNHPSFAPLFSSQSRAEVPIVGVFEGRRIVGQVDRLYLNEKEVWIIDYKTNRPPSSKAADVALPYRRQLASYSAVLQDIYPDRKIRCFLLWTYAAPLSDALMEIPPEL